MKKLLTIIALLISFSAFSQDDTVYVKVTGGGGGSGGSTDTTSLSNRINLKLNISDTAAMLLPYRNAININTAGLLLKLNISDTASMLSSYQNAINLRLKISDTAAMLSSYQSAINTNTANIAGKKNSIDSVSGVAIDYVTQYQLKKTSDSLQSNIDLKLNISDTSGMLSGYQTAINTNTINIAGKADSTAFVHKNYNLTETITGSKTFTTRADFVVSSNQMRIGADATTNYFGISNNGTGQLSLNAIGSNPSINITTSGALSLTPSGAIQTSTSGIASSNFYTATIASGNSSASTITIGGNTTGTGSRTVIGAGSTSTTQTVGANYASLIIPQAKVTEAASSTHPLFANLAVRELLVTAGVAGLDTTASLYVQGPSLSGNFPYSMLVGTGISRFQGNIQNTLGIAVGGTQDASALVDVTSTTKGILIPRHTNAQMSAVASPATGLGLYNTDAKMYLNYDGSTYKSAGVVSGNISTALTAATTITVTFGGTQPNTTYKVNVTPYGSILAVGGYVTNQTTTTFDYVLPITTGTVQFYYAIFQ